MRELETIIKQAEVTALTIHERIARIHDALRTLRDMTLLLYEATPRRDAAIEDWLQQNDFGFDPFGYYERTELLRRARAGEVDPDVQIYYVSEAIARDPEALFRMYALRGLPRALETINENLPGLAWFYYQDATRMVIVYPMHDPCTVVPPDFDWHSYHTYRLVCEENNPERHILWTPPNIDYGGKGLMVAPSIPLYRNDEFFGVWSLDVPVTSLIRDSLLARVVAGQQSFIVDREGVLIAHDSLETLVAPSLGDIYRMPMSELGGGFAELDLESLRNTGQARLTDAQGRLCYVIARPIKSLDWLLVVSIPAQSMLQKMEQSFLDAFDRARSGDFEHRLYSNGEAELQRLVEGYNEMAAAVQSTLEAKERTMRDLEESRDRVRAILEASPVGLCLVKVSGEVVSFNQELADILGIPSSTNDSLDMLQLVPLELAAELERLLDRALARGGAGPVESELLCSNGGFIPVRISGRRLHQRDGMFVLLGIEDISETRRLQSQLLQAQKMDAIGKLASSVAHDLNNILCVIMSNVGVLELKYGKDETAVSHIRDIELASRRAAALTSQLLSFSRKGLIQRTRLDPAKIIRESEQLLRHFIDDNIEFTVTVDEKTPLVRGDVTQFLQIIMNLVINARDALNDVGGVIEIHAVPCSYAGNALAACISVSDNGPGIEPAVRSRIFEPFFTTRENGTGMGLATAHDIVSGMGGTIGVESGAGAGTTFFIRLPAAMATEDSENVVLQPADVPVDGCVLVVDDEPLVREASVRALEYVGIQVRAAADASGALAILEELGDRVAILVTDVVMPGMGGRELATKARALYPRLPVLYMTGYTDDMILRHGVETEEVELLRKPYSPQVFLDVIKRTIARAACRNDTG